MVSAAIREHQRRRTWTNTLPRARAEGGLVGRVYCSLNGQSPLSGCRKSHPTLRLVGGGGAFKIILSKLFFVKIRGPKPRKGQ